MKVDQVSYNEAVIRNMAAVKAEQESHYNTRHKILAGAVLATPLVEGAVHMIKSPKLSINNTAILNSEKFGQNLVNHVNAGLPYVKGAAARSLNGLKAFGNLASYLVAGALVSEVSNKIADKSEKYNNYIKNNGLVNWLAIAGGAVALVAGAKKGVGVIFDKMKPETVEKMFTKLTKHSDAFNNNKLVKAISNGYNSLAGKFSADAQQRIKNIISYATPTVIFGSAAGILANRLNFANKFRANYDELKDQQLAAAAADVAKAS